MVDNQHASAFAPLNHSHTNYVQKGGDTMTGALQMKGSRLELRRSNNTRYGWLDASSAGTYWRLYCDDAYAYFESDEHTGSDWIMEINDLTGEVRCHYDFTVLGSKDFAHPHPTDASKEIRYTALEGGEAGTYVRGTGQLTDGICVITIPEHFGLVTSPAGLTSQVTPRSDCAGLYVVSVTPQQLSVRELQNGTSDAAFDWVVQGVRIGQENKQVIRDKPARPYPKDGFSLGSRRD